MYCASIEAALAYSIPQVGLPNGTGTLPSSAADTIWRSSAAVVKLALQSVGLTISTTTESDALDWARGVESMLTSGQCLRSMGTVGTEEHPSAAALIKDAKDALATLRTPAGYGAIVTMGAEGSSSSASGNVRSDWIDLKDPAFSESAGSGDTPYALPPQHREGEAS